MRPEQRPPEEPEQPPDGVRVEPAWTDDPDRPRRANPTEKKALAYRKDHRIWTKYPQLERRSWPKKKALRNQTYRRQVSRSLIPALEVVTPQIEDFSPSVPRRRKSRWGALRQAMPLGEWVKGRERKRLSLIGRKMLGNFHRERHRKRLVPFLESLIQGRSDLSREFARSFAVLLSLRQRPPGGRWSASRERAVLNLYSWIGPLDQLLEEQPEWEAKLRAWIEEVGGERLDGPSGPERRRGDGP